MEFIDLTQPFFDAGPSVPAHGRLRFEAIRDFDPDGYRMELLSMATHSGTHVDAPLHGLPGGASLDDFPLESFMGDGTVLDLTSWGAREPIDADDLAKRGEEVRQGDIVLVCTGWGEGRQPSDEWIRGAPYLTPDAARWLVERQIKGLGVDCLSPGPVGDRMDMEVHQILLGAGVWIAEDLYIPRSLLGLLRFRFWLAPLRLQGASGAPCRAFVTLDQTRKG